MTWAPTETQVAVYGALSGDSALQTLLGAAGKILNHVPDQTTFPYIVFSLLPFAIRDNYTDDGLEVEFQISSWVQGAGRGDKEVQLIQKRIDELIHEANLSISGWNIIALRRTVIDIQTQEDNRTKHGIQRFKLLLGEA